VPEILILAIENIMSLTRLAVPWGSLFRRSADGRKILQEVQIKAGGGGLSFAPALRPTQFT